MNDCENNSMVFDNNAYAIEAVGLVKRFGNFTAVNDLNFRVEKGKYMGLLGPNGAGKSTTLKMVTGLLDITEGSVKIFGSDIGSHRESLSKVGCVIETPEFYPSFTPSEALQYVGRLRGLSEREIAIRGRNVLENVRMWEWRNKEIGTFSKGMRQRVILAQSMLSNPEMLILDEPTSGLDPRGMIEMRSVLMDLKKHHMAMLISTHMLKEVSEMCDSVTMIDKGTTKATGDVNDMLRNFLSDSDNKTEIVIRTVRPITDVFLKDLSAMDDVDDVARYGDYETRFNFKGNNEQQSEIVNLVQDSGLKLLSLEEHGVDLEKLYMELTQDGGSIK